MQPYPDIALYNLPLVFRESAEKWTMCGPGSDEKPMADLRKKKFVGFGLAEAGFAYPMMKDPHRLQVSKTAGCGPDNDPGALKAYASFNITPIPLPIADVLTGLQTGLIDTMDRRPLRRHCTAMAYPSRLRPELP